MENETTVESTEKKKVVLITGAGTGIGKVTAELFTSRGWQVVATMRNPDKYRDQFDADKFYLVSLDVTKPETIAAAVKDVQERFGRIDVLINNAGYGLYGAFEIFTPEEVRQQYDVNVFGVMHTCREVAPLMREQGGGTIVNISSMGGKFTVPYYSVYNSTKFAVEGFSEGLFYELQPFNIKVKVVEPGAIDTDFYGRSMKTGTREKFMSVYKSILEKMWKQYVVAGKNGSQSNVVAKAIYNAAISSSSKMRYAAGTDAMMTILLSKVLPHQVFMWIMKRSTVDK